MAPSKTRVYNWSVHVIWTTNQKLISSRYASLVAASCMVLYGYDASTFNAISGSKNWNLWFDNIVKRTFLYSNALTVTGQRSQ
jgi:hypothetical protein